MMEKLVSTGVVGHHEELESADLIWVKGNASIASVGLARTLKSEFRVHRGALPPAAAAEAPSAVVCYLEGSEAELEKDDGLAPAAVASVVHTTKAAAPDAPVLVLSPSIELPLIGVAVSAGARGFLHTGTHPQQIARAISVVMAGEMALPREILEAWVEWLNEPRGPDLSSLSKRQSEILELVVEGLSNAQIAKRLFVSESTVKQRLRAAYKVLGAKNRRGASSIVWQARHAR